METAVDLSTDEIARAHTLLAIIADPQATATRLAELEARLKACTAAEAKLANDRAAFDAHEQKTRAELDAEAAAIMKRRVELQTAEGALRMREARVEKLATRSQHIASKPLFPRKRAIRISSCLTVPRLRENRRLLA